MRNVYLIGEITSESIDKIIKELLYFDSVSNEEITMYISSPGGEFIPGLSLIDVIKTLRSKVKMQVLDMAASTAAVILSAGHKRLAYKNSFIMIHEILGSFNYIEQVEDVNKELINILATNMGKTVSQMKKMISFDNYMNTEEALQANIIDEII
ncbi:MAG: ATP-dependent Clp protease proteolytic subunit [Fusobacterium sp.]|nr:ATP-dependent Clp protease proteolytic subunit [Fusobacterium sp.]